MVLGRPLEVGGREGLRWLVGVSAVAVAVAGLPPQAGFSVGELGGLVGVLVGFIAHEAAHKLVALRRGLRAEFVLTGYGLVLTLISAFLPVKLLAPGYVRLWGPAYRLRAVMASVAAGPLANIAISITSLAAAVALAGWGKTFLLAVANINAWLAFFNLLPLNPLDGGKLFDYDKRTWAILAGVSIASYILSATL